MRQNKELYRVYKLYGESLPEIFLCHRRQTILAQGCLTNGRRLIAFR